jgi:phosphatidylglycerophosphate synthase
MRFFEKAFKGFYKSYNNALENLIGKIFPSWITPNGISVFRAFLFLPVLILLLLDFQISAFVLFVFAAYLDSVDGLLARSRKMLTEFGAAIDALMDKLFFVCLLVPTVFLLDYTDTGIFYPIVIFSSLTLIVPVEIWLTVVRWQDYLDFSANKGEKRLIKAGMSGKIKFLLEMCGLGAFVLAYPNPQSNFALLGSFFILLSAPFAYRSLITKINARS